MPDRADNPQPPKPRPGAQVGPKPAPARPGQRQWNVVLLDDQDHTYDYVIRMVQTVFGMGRERADALAQEVDRNGRAICLTTHREHAELKCEQIMAFGRDPLVTQSAGPMQAILEPADGQP